MVRLNPREVRLKQMYWKTKKLGRVQGAGGGRVLNLHKSGNELSLDFAQVW